jgi:hypothetical protein
VLQFCLKLVKLYLCSRQVVGQRSGLGRGEEVECKETSAAVGNVRLLDAMLLEACIEQLDMHSQYGQLSFAGSEKTQEDDLLCCIFPHLVPKVQPRFTLTTMAALVCQLSCTKISCTVHPIQRHTHTHTRAPISENNVEHTDQPPPRTECTLCQSCQS